jgi:hypothetical protein
MPSSGMLRRVALVRTNVSEELSATIIRVTRIGELGTTLAVTSNRCTLWRMASSGMLRRVALIRTDVTEELRTSFIRVTWFGELGTTLAVTSKLVHRLFITFMMEELCSSETSVLTTATRRNIPEDAILYSHRRENLKFYIALTGWTV